MIDNITYNYVCLFNDDCKAHNTTVHITLHKDIDTDNTPQYCECKAELKLIGIATNILHIGTSDGRNAL